MDLNKNDYILLFIIFLLLLMGVCFSYCHISAVYSDIGREFYIPWQMNEGQVLYKDIFNVYAPLAYQINAFLLKLFSDKLYCLIFAGAFASYLALCAVFIITKLYTDRITAFIVSILVLFTCTFYQSISNWIAPYSYSVLYAMTAFLWSFLFSVLYLKNNKINYLILSFFFMGVSLACKYEYALFLFVIVIAAFYKKIGLKNAVFAIISFAFIPMLSFLVLIFQGCRISDFVTALKYIIMLSSSHSVKDFYSFAGFIPSLKSTFNSLFGWFQNNSMLFVFTGYISVLTLFIKRDKLQVYLNISAVVVSLKCLCSLSLELYGTFFLPLLFINLAVLITKEKSKIAEYFIVLFIILCIALNYAVIDYGTVIKNRSNIIVTLDGQKIYTNNDYFAYRYTELINFLNENTELNDRVLVLPEGAMINFLAKRQSDNYLYYLIPPNVEIFSAENIIKRLKDNPPDYILVFYNKYPWYGVTSFSNSYGKDIQNFINEHYDIEEKAASDYDKIYKVRTKNHYAKE